MKLHRLMLQGWTQSWSMQSLVLSCLTALLVLGVGCTYSPKGVRRHPTTGVEDEGPKGKDVFEVTKKVILERYQFASPVVKSNLVMALTPVTMAGASKSRKQITVHIKKNYVGAWEPTVRVVQFIEVAEPELGGDPEATHPGAAVPVAIHKWQPLTYLPAEANSILNSILEELAMPVGDDSTTL